MKPHNCFATQIYWTVKKNRTNRLKKLTVRENTRLVRKRWEFFGKRHEGQALYLRSIQSCVELTKKINHLQNSGVHQ